MYYLSSTAVPVVQCTVLLYYLRPARSTTAIGARERMYSVECSPPSLPLASREPMSAPDQHATQLSYGLASSPRDLDPTGRECDLCSTINIPPERRAQQHEKQLYKICTVMQCTLCECTAVLRQEIGLQLRESLAPTGTRSYGYPLLRVLTPTGTPYR